MPADFTSLTAKQKKVYSTIEAYIKTKGIPPTVREIGELVGEKTPGAVQGILNRLEQKGVIKRELGAARSIQLMSGNSLYSAPKYIPEIKKISRRNIDDLLNIYNISKYQPFIPDYIPPDDTCFIVSCPDNSLFESGIKYGDLLVVCKTANIKDGDILLVMYENLVLLRKYYPDEKSESITLKADSNLLDKEIFKKDEISIIGKLIGKYTRY